MGPALVRDADRSAVCPSAHFSSALLSPRGGWKAPCLATQAKHPWHLLPVPSHVPDSFLDAEVSPLLQEWRGLGRDQAVALWGTGWAQHTGRRRGLSSLDEGRWRTVEKRGRREGRAEVRR